MSLSFVNDDELMTIDMGDNDWVKVPAKLSFGFVSSFEHIKGGDLEKTAHFLVQLIVDWSAKTPEGEKLPISIENIKKLEVTSLKKIMEQIIPLTEVEKKAQTLYGQP